MSEWTYHLQDVRTGDWLSRDFPMRDVEVTELLTGHNTLVGTVVPEDDEFANLLDEWYWGVALFAEKNDVIRAGGILNSAGITDDGQAIGLDFIGYTGYPLGQDYDGKFRLWEADAVDCLRHIWTYIQARGQSDLSLVVDDIPSQVISDPAPPPKPQRADVTYGPVRWGTPGDPWPRPPQPRKPKMRKPVKRKRRPGESTAHWNAYVASYEAKLDDWMALYRSINRDRLPEWQAWHRRLRKMRANWKETYKDYEPYKLSWWEQTDMGEETERLAQEGNFEWRELHTWTVGKADVDHRLELGYPSLGVDRTATVILEVGSGDEEMMEFPDVGLDGMEFANWVTVLGSGEGRKTKRVLVGADDGRLRRQITVEAKRVRRPKRLRKIGNDARSRRTLVRNIPEVVVSDSTMNFSLFQLGDLVSVASTSTWDIDGTTAHRIIGRRYAPDDEDLMYLQLERAERTSDDA